MYHKEKGTCYTDTFEFLLKGSPGFPHPRLSGMDCVSVVHGSVMGETQQRISHAWVELTSGTFAWVWESQFDRVFDKTEYYRETQACPDYKLSITEIICLSFKYKNYGPFSPEEIKSGLGK